MTRRALALCLILAGCDGGGAEVPPQAVAPPPSRGPDLGAQRARADESVPGRGRVVPSDDRSTRPPWVQGGGGGGGGRFPERRGREVMSQEEAQAASRALVEANLEGDSPCQEAYDALARFSEDFQEKAPWVPRRRPDRGRFLESCLALPRPLQQCLVPGYHRSHEQECERVRTEWPSLTGARAAPTPDQGEEG